MRKEKGEIFIFLLNRRKLRVSESRSNVYIDYAEREQLHEGGARVIVESQNRKRNIKVPALKICRLRDP